MSLVSSKTDILSATSFLSDFFQTEVQTTTIQAVSRCHISALSDYNIFTNLFIPQRDDWQQRVDYNVDRSYPIAAFTIYLDQSECLRIIESILCASRPLIIS